MNEISKEQLFDTKVETFARILAKQRGFDPDQLVFFGEPTRVTLTARGVGFLVPSSDHLVPVWQCLVQDVHVALAVMGMLPGQSEAA